MLESLKQLRDHFPEASMFSDVLTIQNQQYVVRVTIQIPPSRVFTGLSSHLNLELAEDHARQRALQLLGLGDHSSPLPQQTVPHSVHPASKQPPPLEDISDSQLNPDASPAFPRAIEERPDSDAIGDTQEQTPAHKQSEQPTRPTPVTPTRSQPVAVSDSIRQISTQPRSAPVERATPPTVEATKSPSASHHTATAALPNSATPLSEVALPAPINLSDVIAQTDIELRRLGWSTETGREYLEQTYDKRSRHELSEEELIQFLCYLEGIPSPEAI